MRASIAGRATIAGTNLLPLVSLYSAATGRPRIREVGLTNSTSTALVAALVRLTTTGTQGAGLSEICWDDPTRTPNATGFAGHTVGPTITAGVIRQGDIGAAIGSGIVWSFGGNGLEITEGVANGVGIIVPVGTGQILDYWVDWEE